MSSPLPPSPSAPPSVPPPPSATPPPPPPPNTSAKVPLGTALSSIRHAMRYAPISGDYFRCFDCMAAHPLSVQGETCCEACSAFADEETANNQHVWCMVGSHKVAADQLVGSRQDLLTCCKACKIHNSDFFFCGGCQSVHPTIIMVPDEAKTGPKMYDNATPRCLYCEHPLWSNVEQVFWCTSGSHQVHGGKMLSKPVFTRQDLQAVCSDCDVNGKHAAEVQEEQSVVGNPITQLGDLNTEMKEDGPTPVSEYHQLVSIENVPDSLSFTETCTAYKADTNSVHRDYRAADRKTIKAVAGSGQKLFDTLQQAVIQINFEEDFGAVFGDISAKTKGFEMPPSLVRVNYKIDTQVPSVHLVIASEGNKENPVTAIVYSDAIAGGTDYFGTPAGIRCTVAESLTKMDWEKFDPVLNLNVGVQELRDGLRTETPEGIVHTDVGKVWVTSLAIDSRRIPDPSPAAATGLGTSRFSGSQDEMGLHPTSRETMATEAAALEQSPPQTRSKVRFFGVTADQVDRYRQVMMARDYDPMAIIDDSENIPEQQQIIGLLACGNFDLHIFTRVATDNVPLLCYDFIPYFLGLIKTSIVFGNFWFYRRQRDSSLSLMSDHFTLEGLQVPRWLVKEMKVTYDQDDKPLGMEPTKWGAYSLPSILCEEDCVFMVRLAVYRERCCQRSAFSNLFGSEGGATCTATFTPNPQNGNQYVVEILLANLTKEAEWDIRLPAIGNRVAIDLEKAGSRFRGIVTHDLFHRGAHLTVFVEGEHPPETGEELRGHISVEEDSTTSACEINAVMTASTMSKDSGVDIAALLRLREPTVSGADIVKKAFEEHPDAKETYIRTIDGHVPKLSKKQREAAIKVIESEDGLELIVGAPGSGKTTLNQLIVEGLAQTGMRVTVVSRTDDFVDRAYNIFKKLTKLPSHQFVRFRGEATPDDRSSHFNRKADYKSKAQTQERMRNQGMNNDLWEMISSSGSTLNLNEDEYHAKLYRWVSMIAEYLIHPMKASATEYLGLVKRLQSTASNEEVGKELRDDIRKLRTTTLAREYLGNNVRVVFTTTSSACSDILWNYYAPSAVFCEDAALSPISELAIPLAAFFGSIKLVVLSGDYKQQHPIMMSAEANETGKVLQTSLFEILIRNEKREHTRLNASYRLSSNLIGWMDQEFYDSKMGSDRESDSGLDASMEAILRPLKGANCWNERRRIAVDVSTHSEGSTVVSEMFVDTASLCNQAEANAVVRLLQRCLQFNPKNARQKHIKPEHILVISPYLGQVRLIKRILATADLGDVRVADLRVSTTAQAQGDEAEIVLVSFVRNELDDPLKFWFKHPSQLCVELSRAKDWLFIFGKFYGWMCARHSKNPTLKKTAAFRAFNKLLTHIHNKDDWVTGTQLQAALEDRDPSGPKFSEMFS